MATEKVRLNVDVSRDLDDMLGAIAADYGTTKSDVLRRGIGLLKAAHDAARQGKRVGVAKPDQALDTEFINL